MNLRVVFDTNTLVSAAILPDSLPDQALSFALLRHRVYTSAATVAELERILNQPKFDRYGPIGSRMLFLKRFQRDALAIYVSESELAQVNGACRDSGDEAFLALCLSARAHVLVSGDFDLLTLSPWRGMEIVTAAQFLSLYGGDFSE
jgi:putative PIN family toxin of toxin-antitoxin system